MVTNPVEHFQLRLPHLSTLFATSFGPSPNTFMFVIDPGSISTPGDSEMERLHLRPCWIGSVPRSQREQQQEQEQKHVLNDPLIGHSARLLAAFAMPQRAADGCPDSVTCDL